MRELYRNGVLFTPDHRLLEIYQENEKLIAVLRNEYTDAEEEREVDQIVVEHGTLPMAELYFSLKPHSVNRGEFDSETLATEDRVVDVIHNPDAGFRLYRVGDAVTSRNIYAAIYDSLRLCHDL